MRTGQMHRVPVRTCIVCNRKRAKAELLRLVLNATDKVCLDQRQRGQGRGAYICVQPECLARLKPRQLERAFRKCLPEDAWSPAQAMVATFQSHGDSELNRLELTQLMGDLKLGGMHGEVEGLPTGKRTGNTQ